jgi:uncharacterized protein YndB with AHSA1/START domain
MRAAKEREPASINRTVVERRSDRELVVTRTVNGPARLVFEAWTKPELLKRWWAPCSLGVSLLECDADVRVGGRYRYVFGRDARHPMAFSGVYTNVTPYSTLVYTQIFEPLRDAGEAIVTVTLAEHRGKTRLVLRELYPSKEALDGAVASGMEHGIRETLEQLDQLVASLTADSNVLKTATSTAASPVRSDQ